MDNAAFKMMLLSIRSDSNNNLSLHSQSNVSTKEQPKSYDNNNNNNNEDQDYFIQKQNTIIISFIMLFNKSFFIILLSK